MDENNRLIWVSDIHLNFLTGPHPTEGENMRSLSEAKVKSFCDQILSYSPLLGVVLTGDITEAPYIDIHLAWLSKHLDPLPVYFVLGNHDYYNGSIQNVRSFVSQFDKNSSTNLRWLNVCDVVQLTEATSLVGHDGWYDGLYANWFAPRVVVMNDYFSIKELNEQYTKSGYPPSEPCKQATFDVLQKLAGECADHINTWLPKAVSSSKNVLFATHVPPFKENAVYNGKVSDNNWLPNFSSKLAGDALLEVAKANPLTQYVALCGHSHGEAEFHPLSNLTCLTRYAKYGSPEKSIKLVKIE
jgi:predicted phosphohydrolase